ncbi:MAG: MaoC family dehydratase [Actinomycetia bacterium]|nr:MaoC family dehydratase [Actinomycetes bacterium]
MSNWPKLLASVDGPIRIDRLDGAAEGMGTFGEQTRALHAEDLLPPDLMTGLTLFLLSNQPRDPAKKQAIPGGGGGVAGGVWVRERFTIHRPLGRSEVFTVSGKSVGQYVHKGRRYGTNISRTLDAGGELAASNITTGLLSYKVDEVLGDSIEGQSPDDIEPFGPDWDVATDNLCLDALRALTVGDEFGGHDVFVGLDLMAARDTKNPDNPIHSDPELARKAGLSEPIAGGNHVLSFVLEVVMDAVGRHSLLHGTCFDIRWKAPVYADTTMRPHACVTQATPDHVTFELRATLTSGATAMAGTATVPLP